MSILYYLKNMGLVMLCLLPFWALVRLVFLKKTGRKTSLGREALLALFALYLAALARQTVLPRLVWDGEGLALMGWGVGGANYIPFVSIRRYLRLGLASAAGAVNLAGNVGGVCPTGAAAAPALAPDGAGLAGAAGVWVQLFHRAGPAPGGPPAGHRRFDLEYIGGAAGLAALSGPDKAAPQKGNRT